jgi:hypothetical protein
MVKVICKDCGIEFEAKKRTAKYCPKCKAERRKTSYRTYKQKTRHKEKLKTVQSFGELEKVIIDPMKEIKTGMTEEEAKKKGFMGDANVIIGYDENGDNIWGTVKYDLRKTKPTKLQYNQRTGEYELVEADLPLMEVFTPAKPEKGLGTQVYLDPAKELERLTGKPAPSQMPKKTKEERIKEIEEFQKARRPEPPKKREVKPMIEKEKKEKGHKPTIYLDQSYLQKKEKLTYSDRLAVRDAVNDFVKTKKDYDRVVTDGLILHIAKRKKGGVHVRVWRT